MDKSYKIARILLQIKAVAINVKAPYTYNTGIISPIYCDNRLLMAYPEYYIEVRDAFIELIHEHDIKFDIVGGTATAGIPHAAWVAQYLNKPMLYVRSKSKGYGHDKLIEGRLEKGNKVLIIDDLVTTGGSSLAAVESVRSGGGIVNECFCIFNYGLDKSALSFGEAYVMLYSLTDLIMLLETAVEEGSISLEEKEAVMKWREGPETWGK